MTTAQKMRRLTDGDKRTAYHEAAHAVAGHLLGWTIERVTVLSDEHVEAHGGLGGNPFGVVNGRVSFTNRHPVRGEPDAEVVSVNLVGHAAERRLCQELGWSDPGEDLEEGYDLFDGPYYFEFANPDNPTPDEQRTADEYERAFRAGVEQSRRFIADDTNWRAVKAVAETLLAHEERDGYAACSGEGTHALIRQALNEE
jgi:hypothetical protein